MRPSPCRSALCRRRDRARRGDRRRPAPVAAVPAPGLFAALFALSVDQFSAEGRPAARRRQLLHLAVLRRRLHRAAPARSGADDAHRDRERLVAVHVPDEAAQPAYKTLFSMACLAVTVAATRRVYTWLGGTYGQLGRRCRR